MRLTTLLAAICAVAVLGAVSVDAQELHRLDTKVVPTFQSIHLKLDAGEKDYMGTTSIHLNVVEATDSFEFHTEALTLTSLTLTDPKGNSVAVTHGTQGVLTMVTAEVPLSKGRYVLDIAFSNNFDTTAHGLYRMDFEGEGYSFTQFEADDAREAFPCWDEPNFKFPYQMTLTVPEGHMAVSNTPIEEQTTADGWVTNVFAKSKPMSSYLLAIATGPLEAVDMPGLGVPGRVVTCKGQSHLAGLAVEITPPLLQAMEEYFDSKYPYSKLDLIAVPEFWPGAMENIGAITYADRILLIDPEAASAGQKRSLAAVTAHELAHMWFGDVVTMEWWDDLWLNESFASWMGDKITHQVFSQFQMDIREVRGTNRALSSDAQLATRAIRQPVAPTDNLMQSADVLAYQKGQAVLGMTEKWLGEATFRKGVLKYIRENRWGNATGDDLWRSLDAVSDQPVVDVLVSFLDQPGFPLVSVNQMSGNQIKISQRRFVNAGVDIPEKQTWIVPITLKWADKDGGVHEKQILLKDEETVVEVPKDAMWLHPNADESGYYRWSTSSGNLVNLAKHGQQDLTVRERVGYLNNLGALMTAGSVAGDDYLRSLSMFANDPDSEVISALLSGLGGVEGALLPPEAEDYFATYVRHTLTPAMDRFGMQAKEGEPETVTSFRSSLLNFMGRYGKDEAVLSYCTDLAHRYIEDSSSIDNSLAGMALRIAAMRGDRDLYETYKTKFESAKVPAERTRYLGAMGRFMDPEIRDEALDYALNGPLRPQEIGAIPQGVAAVSTDEDFIWNWSKTHYETIAGKFPPMYRIYLPYFGMGCDEDRIADVEAFFTRPEVTVEGMDKSLAKVAEATRTCAGTRERERDAVVSYLKEFDGRQRELSPQGK